MAGSMVTNRRWRGGFVMLATTVIVLFLLLFLFLRLGVNRRNSYESSEVLVMQVEDLVDSSEKSTEALEASLKEDYVLRATAIAYILDKDPKAADDSDELEKIARLQAVDEIHLFDETGTIVGGTVPRYFGLSFDSGEQMAFFKPMLSDHARTMCQDVTPNTAEGKQMMYAICWNEAGTRMIQVGIEPVHLLEEMHASSPSEVVAALPTYDGTEVMIADRKTGEVLSSSVVHLSGMNLADFRFDVSRLDAAHFEHKVIAVNGTWSYGVARLHGDYVYLVTQGVAVANAGTMSAMVVVVSYLVIAALIIAYILSRMTKAVLEEQRNANEDKMTGFLNRRAYEAALAEYEGEALEPNLVYFSFDLNGLKRTNDTLGHDAGDRLIIGCAECLQRCVGNYGRLFRIGGDEFCALAFAEGWRVKIICRDIAESSRRWSEQNGLELSVSVGTASVQEMPEASLGQIAKRADELMYAAKRAYYEDPAHDRRGA